MNKLLLFITSAYQNLKIKYKLVIFISFIMVVSLSFMLIGLQYAFQIYDEQIYRKSSQVLMMSSNSIEDELKKVEEISFDIITDNDIQRNLRDLKGNISGYEQYRIQNELWDRLTSYAGSEKYIHSIHLFDANGREYVAGTNSAALSKEQRDLIIYQAAKQNGGTLWITPGGFNDFLFSARQVRAYENLSLDKLGTLVIHVDLEKIVRDLPKEWEETAGSIMISNGQDVFFSEKTINSFKQFDFSNKTKQGYKIQKVGGQRYFITHIQSSYADWTYWNIIPFNLMFAKVTAVKYSLIFLFILLSLFVLSLGVRFSKRITSPIEKLVAAMKHVQKGDFAIAESLPAPPLHQDEVGTLHRNFTIMIQRINELIKENYEKQLLIKETEFKALQAQINPHFLYNTLESINWLAKANQQKQISKMVESLGYLLRNSISMKEDIIMIEKEIEIVQSYITIQQYRFEERLDFSLDIPPDFQSCYIPKLTVQPLIENAIHYALEPSIEPCKITVRAFRKEACLYLTVEDNGPGMDTSLLDKIKSGQVKTRGTGIGLQNIDERIKLSFGEQYGLQIESSPDKGTAVSIILPYQMGCEEYV
ncbi:cache domain-containing sensor histidine kinase [Ectobacillus funiculus]|uniref:histidine kinase n=1 Tax=Ectobacillus funiculus TaxID=137993 RepID=A0ABV5WF51_9BACI